MARLELGSVVHVLLRRRAYRRLGFVRLRDYARERFGVSGRTLEEAASVAARLEKLPAVTTAFQRSEITWTQARAICRVANAADEQHWLDLAARHDVEALQRFVRVARAANHRATGAANRSSGNAIGDTSAAADPDTDDDEHLIDGEPTLRLRLACPARLRGLWRWAVELASRMAGEPLSEWRAAEIIAAEGSSGRPAGAEIGERALVACMRVAHHAPRPAMNVAAATQDRNDSVARHHPLTSAPDVRRPLMLAAEPQPESPDNVDPSASTRALPR